MALRILSEQPSDFSAVREMVRASFATAKASDGDEHEFVAAMRGHPGYIPELALVAWDGDSMAGYVLLTATNVEGPEGSDQVLLLAPLAVAPDFQGRGVGAALMREALERARAQGFRAVFLAGDPAYYRRFGFRPATAYGIGHELPVDDQYILVHELFPGALDAVHGTVVMTGHDTCAAATGKAGCECPT